MIQTEYYHKLLETYVIIFGTLFNNIYINRKDSSGNVINNFKVPISYSPRDKLLATVERDLEDDRNIALILPRIGFEIVGMNYSIERKLSSYNKINTSDKRNSVRYPVPYDIQLKLSVMSKTETDGMKIVEQILPYFTPDWTVTSDLLTNFNLNMDIPVILNDVNMSDEYAADLVSRRMIIWELNFTMHGFFFGPVVKPKLIKIANANLKNATSSSLYETVTVRPGLDANGNPTSNSAITIPYMSVEASDNYGYIIDISNELFN